MLYLIPSSPTVTNEISRLGGKSFKLVQNNGTHVGTSFFVCLLLDTKDISNDGETTQKELTF